MQIEVVNREEISRQLREWGAKLIYNAGKYLYQGVADRTPVDSGTAKANWNCSVNAPDCTYNEFATFDPDRAAQAFLRVEAGDTLFITNCTPYILELENGSSPQAPEGMALVTIRECAQKIESGEIQ